MSEKGRRRMVMPHLQLGRAADLSRWTYFDDDKELRGVSSGDVNAYLREITGADITAKDFRTWAGTVLMARFLNGSGGFESAELRQSAR